MREASLPSLLIISRAFSFLFSSAKPASSLREKLPLRLPSFYPRKCDKNENILSYSLSYSISYAFLGFVKRPGRSVKMNPTKQIMARTLEKISMMMLKMKRGLMMIITRPCGI